MITIIGCNKGGAGKTTTAINLAVAMAKRGLDVCLVDADPQRSAAKWHAERESGGICPAITLVEKGGNITIESSFRDIKDYKFGMGMGDMHVSSPARRDRLFLFSALAIVLLTLLGKAGDSVGLERTIKANTSKTRTYSFFRQGCIYYQLLPKMKEENALKLMEKFTYLLSQHQLFRDIFGII